MNENIFNRLINEYINFREKIKIKINQSFFFYGLEDCYLIDELCIDNLKICFKIYKKTGNLSLPEINPKFINDISEYIYYIKNKRNSKLISKNLINNIYRNELKNNSIVNYYGGNGKLIIEFKYKYEDDSILLFNPLEKCNIEKNIFIFSTIRYNDKISLYKYIIDNILHSKIKDESIINQNTFSIDKYIEKNCLNNSSFRSLSLLKRKSHEKKTLF